MDTHYDEINGDCVLDFVDAGSYIATNDVLEFIFEDGEELVVDYTVIDSILTITVTMEGIEFIDVYMSVEDLDINDSSSADLVGTWIYTQSFKNGVDEELDDCVLMDTITFTSTDITSDVHNVIDGVCVEDGSSTQDYIATNSTITVIEFDQVDGEEVEDSTTVNYSINGSILTFLIESEFRVEDENGDLIEDEEGEYVTEITSFREVYTRVN